MDTAKQSASPRTLDEAFTTGQPVPRVRIWRERLSGGSVLTKVVPIPEETPEASSPEEQPEKQREG